jgi:hypothetical protein
MKLNDLVGIDIRQALFNGGSIYLETQDDKVYQLYPFGECCSECSIEHVEFADALIGVIHKIEDIEEKEMLKDYDVITTWGHRFHTDKGICTVDMRLEHNGYYGGELDITELDDAAEERELRSTYEVLKDF